ncbi:hypothetical protein CBOM_06897 [Ceraceosorus bombacis]|uniref:Uncharacterized protein n=1 Tax=Ceraceosorus bombacis TaxID=401625 RepID=A0A0P1BTW2_9BASI|nr:hypothetical protein CBOM_06897 [Ceraceosorus bombacis]
MSSTTLLSSPHATLRTFSAPFSRFGIIPVGGRSTAARLSDGGVWVLASTPLDDVTKRGIEELGNEVKYIIAPDVVHHLYIKDFAMAYPGAKVIGVDGLEKKRTDVKWDGLYGKDAPDTRYGFEDDISARYFSTFANKDVAFCHHESKSLITADLIFNLPCNEQYSKTSSGRPTSLIPFLSFFSKYMVPSSSFHQSFLWSAGAAAGQGSTSDRRKQFAKDAQAVSTWEFERIIMCHGDVLEGREKAKKAWREACAKYLDADGKPKV